MRIDQKARRERTAERAREEPTSGDKGRLTEDEARADHPKKVLFVCRANICRSPMAEAIFNAVAEDRGLAYRAASAGVAALVDEDMAPNARAALEELGIYARGIAAGR